jgi:hypothetical protein
MTEREVIRWEPEVEHSGVKRLGMRPAPAGPFVLFRDYLQLRRDRDALWCHALTVLDTKQIEAVTKAFNMIRPDAIAEQGS